jgi:hypothetical protein
MARLRSGQAAHRKDADPDAGFHVECPGTVEASVSVPDRHAFEGPDRPDCVEVSEQEHGPSCASKSRSDVIASIRARQNVDRRAERAKPLGEHAATAIDSGFVGARRFEGDQGLDQIERVIEFAFAKRQQWVHGQGFYNSRMGRSAVFGLVVVVSTGVVAAAAQTPQPFPRPGNPKPVMPAPSTPQAPPPQQPAPVALPPAQPSTDAPTETTLGVQVYPGAEFIASYNAGRGQRYYLYGTNASFLDIVNYYKTTLKQKGELVYEEPPIHQFDIGRFREETMAFPPSVTVKDYTWGGSAGYLNPKRGATPQRFKTIIQIVPPVPGS